MRKTLKKGIQMLEDFELHENLRPFPREAIRGAIGGKSKRLRDNRTAAVISQATQASPSNGTQYLFPRTSPNTYRYGPIQCFVGYRVPYAWQCSGTGLLWLVNIDGAFREYSLCAFQKP